MTTYREGIARALKSVAEHYRQPLSDAVNRLIERDQSIGRRPFLTALGNAVREGNLSFKVVSNAGHAAAFHSGYFDIQIEKAILDAIILENFEGAKAYLDLVLMHEFQHLTDWVVYQNLPNKMINRLFGRLKLMGEILTVEQCLDETRYRGLNLAGLNKLIDTLPDFELHDRNTWTAQSLSAFQAECSSKDEASFLTSLLINETQFAREKTYTRSFHHLGHIDTNFRLIRGHVFFQRFHNLNVSEDASQEVVEVWRALSEKQRHTLSAVMQVASWYHGNEASLKEVQACLEKPTGSCLNLASEASAYLAMVDPSPLRVGGFGVISKICDKSLVKSAQFIEAEKSSPARPPQVGAINPHQVSSSQGKALPFPNPSDDSAAGKGVCTAIQSMGSSFLQRFIDRIFEAADLSWWQVPAFRLMANAMILSATLGMSVDSGYFVAAARQLGVFAIKYLGLHSELVANAFSAASVGGVLTAVATSSSPLVALSIFSSVLGSSIADKAADSVLLAKKR